MVQEGSRKSDGSRRFKKIRWFKKVPKKDPEVTKSAIKVQDSLRRLNKF